METSVFQALRASLVSLSCNVKRCGRYEKNIDQGEYFMGGKNSIDKDIATLDELIEEIIIDAYGDDE